MRVDRIDQIMQEPAATGLIKVKQLHFTGVTGLPVKRSKHTTCRVRQPALSILSRFPSFAGRGFVTVQPWWRRKLSQSIPHR
jgi:hypothetical protein